MSTGSQPRTSDPQPHNPGTQPGHRKYCSFLQGRPLHFRLFLACLLMALVVTLVAMWTQEGMARDHTFLTSLFRDRRCPHFLQGAARGRWVPQPMTPDDVRLMEEFHLANFKVRGLSPWAQRKDGRCGNVSFEADSHQRRRDTDQLFRALCDPRGPQPCCQQGRCVNRTAEQCDCRDCYDWRRLPNAEFARWETTDPRCRPLNFTGKEACRFLGNATLVFYGDSMIRDFFCAMLMLLGEDFRFGALDPKTPNDVKQQCEGLRMFGMPVCREHTKQSDVLCQGMVQVQFFSYKTTGDIGPALTTMRRLLHRQSAFLMAGMGVHAFLDVNKGMTYITALHAELHRANASWPHLIWVTPNAAGLLRADNIDLKRFPQNSARFRYYHEQTTPRIAALGVPILDTWNLTSGAASFDGIHVGLGLNLEKCRVLLTYLQQYLTRPPGH